MSFVAGVVGIACEKPAEPPEPVRLSCSTEAECEVLRDRIGAEYRQCLGANARACDPEMQAAMEVARLLEAARERAAEAKRVQRKAEDQEAREEQVRANEYAEKRRQAVSKWQYEIMSAPASSLNCDPCNAEVEDVSPTDEDRSTCFKICEGRRQQIIRAATNDAVNECINAHTKGCVMTVPAPPAEASQLLLDCNKMCAQLRTPAPPPPPVSSPKPAAAKCGGNALCCDGACSPSCACPGHQGCCSHHGGVCGC